MGELPPYATEEDYENAKQIVSQILEFKGRVNSSDDYIEEKTLNLMSIIYAKGGDYSTDMIWAFGDTYVDMVLRDEKSTYDKNIMRECLLRFPESKAVYEEHLSTYEELLQHLFYPEVINEPLIELLEKNQDPEKAKQYCEFIEYMWRYGDDSIKNVVDVSLLERMSDDPEIWHRFETYISDEFKAYINEVSV